MFQKWQRKWGLSPRQLFWVLVVFAITGTTTAWLAREAVAWAGWQGDAHWGRRLGLRLFILLVGYQIIVLTVAFLLGQWNFFWKYEQKLLRRMRLLPREKMVQAQKIKIAVFASGSGSNAEALIHYFKNNDVAEVALVVSNKPDAGVLQKAAAHAVPTLIIERERFFRGDAYVPELKQKGIGAVLLAGFLWKVPPLLIAAFPQRILNIHPALLPKYGGKGMWGHHVHEAVLAAGEPESGITIHYVDEQYDHGRHLFQARCAVLPGDTPQTLAARVLQLEHRYYGPVAAEALRKN